LHAEPDLKAVNRLDAAVATTGQELCLDKMLNKRVKEKNPRRYDSTPKRFQADLDKKVRMAEYVQNKSWDLLIAYYYVMVDWEKQAHELKEKGIR